MQQCEQEQIDPQQALTGLQKILEHSGQHLANAKGAEQTPEYKQLSDQWRTLARYLNTVQAKVEAQQQETPPQQQMSEDAMIQMQKAQGDNQIKQFKAQQNEQRAWRKLAFNERLNDVKTGSGIRRDNLKTITSIRQSNAKATA